MPVGQPVLDTNYKHLINNTNVNLDINDDNKSDYNNSNYNSILRENLHKMDNITGYNHQLGVHLF